LKDQPFANQMSMVTVYCFGYAAAPTVVGAFKLRLGWSMTYFILMIHGMFVATLLFAAHLTLKQKVRVENNCQKTVSWRTSTEEKYSNVQSGSSAGC